MLGNLSKLVIKPAYPSIGSDPEFGEELSKDQLEKLRNRLFARPTEYVAQEHIDSRTVPVLNGDQIEARRFVIRAHAIADHETYTVMAGA